MKIPPWALIGFSGVCAASAIGAEAAFPTFTVPVLPAPIYGPARVNVRDYGARGDGTSNDTPAINRAIEACNQAGGGDVSFPAGIYAAASIHLLSHVRLLLDREAVITGAESGYLPAEPNPNDRYQDFGHSHFHNALMWGENLEDFSIEGGQVNGGHIITGEPKPRGRDIGDKVIAVRVGRNLRFRNVRHATGGHFVYLLDDCENVELDHVTIQKSRDAVDFMGCRNVLVHDCRFTGCVDDTIGVKSDWALGRRIETSHIFVWASYFESGCNGLQFGSETAGDFHDIHFWDIEIGRAMKAGIGITCNDGAVIDGVTYYNIQIRGAACPIYFLITDRLRSGDPAKKTGTIRNVWVSHVTATGCQPGRQGPVETSAISGRPESPMENLYFSDVHLTYPGNADPSALGVVPPYPKDYSPRSLGSRPASGFYIRHVRNLVFRNVVVDFEKKGEDPRPPIVASDVHTFTLEGTSLETSPGVKPLALTQVTEFRADNSPGIPAP